MKSLLLLAAAFAPCLTLAQAPALSPAGSSTPAAASSPSATPASAGNAHDAASTVPLPGQASGPALEKNIPLIPETAPGTSRPSHSGKAGSASAAGASASPHEFATFAAEEDIRMRVHLRQAATRVLNDPTIQAEWAAAHRVPTDPQRRALLAIYYNHFYDLMIKLDPSVAVRANLRRQSSLSRLKYTRLGDTDNSEDPFVPVAPVVSGPNPPPPSDSSQPALPPH